MSTKTQCELTMQKNTLLAEEERYKIYEGVTEKRSHREIAGQLSKHHSNVSRGVLHDKRLTLATEICAI
jgi:IS30 family transposase